MHFFYFFFHQSTVKKCKTCFMFSISILLLIDTQTLNTNSIEINRNQWVMHCQHREMLQPTSILTLYEVNISWTLLRFKPFGSMLFLHKVWKWVVHRGQKHVQKTHFGFSVDDIYQCLVPKIIIVQTLQWSLRHKAKDYALSTVILHYWMTVGRLSMTILIPQIYWK